MAEWAKRGNCVRAAHVSGSLDDRMGIFGKGKGVFPPPRTPAPRATCPSSAPEDAADAVIFTDSLFGLGDLAFLTPRVGDAGFLGLANAKRDVAMRGEGTLKQSGGF